MGKIIPRVAALQTLTAKKWGTKENKLISKEQTNRARYH